MAGFINKREGRMDLGDLRRMQRTLRHRGPDGSGVAVWSGGARHDDRASERLRPDMALGHTRLSILDLTSAAHQPMHTSDGRYSLVFNGEIYNYLELRRELGSLGHSVRSSGDTEVLLNALAQWRMPALQRLVGMFAFALVDSVQRCLYLVRDSFGIKPLYYTIGDPGLAFASESKALLELHWVSREVDPDSLHHFLRHGRSVGGVHTMFRHIRQVPAGHFLEVPLDDLEEARLVRYWRPTLHPNDDLTFEGAAEHLREAFLSSVRIHLRSDKEVGAALSGGIDSSSIVMAMRSLSGDDMRLHTFSHIADDPRINEEKWVDIVTRAAGTFPHKVSPTAKELLTDADLLVAAHDDPPAGTSLYAQYRVFQLAAEAGIKVVLDGQGADEMLGGYAPHLAARLVSLVRQKRWVEAARFLWVAAPSRDITRRWTSAATCAYFLPARLQEPLRRMLGLEWFPPWVNRTWFDDRGVTARAEHYDPGPDALRTHLLRSVVEFGLPDLLRHEDRNSMAWSVESRVPFVTPELVEFCLSLPERYLLADDGTSKSVFRAAMAGIVPREVLSRRDKIGFPAPDQAWLEDATPALAEALKSLSPHGFIVEERANLENLDDGGRSPTMAQWWQIFFLSKWAEHYEVVFA